MYETRGCRTKKVTDWHVWSFAPSWQCQQYCFCTSGGYGCSSKPLPEIPAHLPVSFPPRQGKGAGFGPGAFWGIVPHPRLKWKNNWAVWMGSAPASQTSHSGHPYYCSCVSLQLSDSFSQYNLFFSFNPSLSWPLNNPSWKGMGTT